MKFKKYFILLTPLLLPHPALAEYVPSYKKDLIHTLNETYACGKLKHIDRKTWQYHLKLANSAKLRASSQRESLLHTPYKSLREVKKMSKDEQESWCEFVLAETIYRAEDLRRLAGWD